MYLLLLVLIIVYTRRYLRTFDNRAYKKFKKFGFSGRGPEKTRNPKFGVGSGRVRLFLDSGFSGRGPEGGQKFGSGRVSKIRVFWPP